MGFFYTTLSVVGPLAAYGMYSAVALGARP